VARYLLDSDAVIDYLRGIADSLVVIRGLGDAGDLLCVCDVVLAEVYSGLRPEDRSSAGVLLDTLHYLPTSPEAARQAGEWRYHYARRGVVLPATDILIAATAHAHQASVLTGNTDDYPMPEVSLRQLPRRRGRA
jgi:predicted nucleic acid-binding protein